LSQRGIFRALRHREYRLLFAGFVINQTGFWVSHISVQGLMVELSGNDPFQVGLLFSSLLLPALVLAPVAGVAADRFDRKTILVLCNLAVAALAAILAAAATTGVSAGALLLLGFALGATLAFAGPASNAIAANAVDTEDLSSAVALQSAANNLTRVVGPLLAAPLVATGRFTVAFAYFSAAALASALLISRMRVAATPRDAHSGGVIARIRGGLAHARERPPALAALVTAAGLSIFGVAHIAMLPVYAEEVLGRTELFAWIVATTAFGAMIGALLTGREARPTLMRAALRLVVYGVALGIFATTHSVVVAFAAQVVVGYCYFAVMTGLQTLLQQLVDDSNRGRVMSLFQVAWAGLTPIGSLTLGAVARFAGVGVALQGAAAGCLAVGAVMAVHARSRDR
jgi:MFS family permease